ncbi:MAG: hypothetical protein KDK70_04870 [Myxococcales bacterium]|nr:hypothetical protein [Myxococcales bacterium]
MLLELLVSEREGEPGLCVGDYLGRARAARSLCRLRLADWTPERTLVFTAVGRAVAEQLATRLVDRAAYAALVS